MVKREDGGEDSGDGDTAAIVWAMGQRTGHPLWAIYSSEALQSLPKHLPRKGYGTSCWFLAYSGAPQRDCQFHVTYLGHVATSLLSHHIWTPAKIQHEKKVKKCLGQGQVFAGELENRQWL